MDSPSTLPRVVAKAWEDNLIGPVNAPKYAAKEGLVSIRESRISAEPLAC
jgi:hypothetical protein